VSHLAAAQCRGSSQREWLLEGFGLKDEANIRWNEKMAELQAKQKVAREKLDELRTSTGEAWGLIEKGAQGRRPLA